MKKVAVENAVGMELCYDITAMRDGFKGAAFKRGHIITEPDIPALLDIGKRTVLSGRNTLARSMRRTPPAVWLP